MTVGPALIGLGGMFSQAFMQHALIAGTAVAAASGIVGYFLVLRSQVFTGDALSHVAFTGALAALAAGVDLRFGLYVATIGVAVLMGGLGRKGRADDVVIGSVFAWILGLGVLFLSIYTTSRSTADATAGVSVLFGSIFGISASETWVAVAVAGAVVTGGAFMARPLLFASVDDQVAAARGVPVRVVGIAFLGVVGATAALAAQAVGSLLLLGLMAAPAGTALRLTTRPFRALWLSTGLAIAELWVGLTLSYEFGSLPPSFSIMAVAAGVYAVTLAVTAWRGRAGALAAVGGVVA